MIEKDNIQELFSKSLENHTMTVRPELWAGVQAKMGAAAATTAVASKGVSLLTKWIVGGLITSSAVVVGVVALSNDSPVEKSKTEQTSETKIAANSEKEIKSVESIAGKTELNAAKLASSVNNSERAIIAIDNTNEDVNPSFVAAAKSDNESKKENTGVVPVQTKVSATNSDVKQQKPDAPVDRKPIDEEQKKPVAPIAPAVVKVQVVLPNIFTPNNDGENDEYLLKEYDNVSSDDFSVTIMDASNKPVWKDDNPNFKWDGNMMSGEKAPEGKYICMIVGKDSSGKQFSKYTIFQLKRD